MKLAIILILSSIFLAVFLYANNPFKKMVLSSEVQGQLMLGGLPLADAVIERELRWSWKSETIVDQVKSDSAGMFGLPQVLRTSLSAGLLPHQPNIRQTITAIHEGKKYNLWMHDKGDYKDLSEFNGKKVTLNCSVEKESVRNEEFNSFGICEFKQKN